MTITTTTSRNRRLLVGLGLTGATLAAAAPTAAAAVESPVHVVDDGGQAHRVQFAAGTDYAIVGGTLGDGISDRFVLRAGAGQQLVVSDLGSLHVSVTAPDGSLLAGGPGDTVPFDLPATGDYLVEIMPGMGETSRYEVTLTIPAGRHDPPAVRVQFPSGTFGTTVHGQVDGGVVNRYLLRTGAGRAMTVTIDADRDAARFSVLAPDGTVILNEQTSATTALLTGGDYTVAVWSLDGNPSYDIAFDIR